MKDKKSIVSAILSVIAVVAFFYSWLAEEYWAFIAAVGLSFIVYSIMFLIADRNKNENKLKFSLIAMAVTGCYLMVTSLLWGIGPYDISDWINDHIWALILLTVVFIGVTLMTASLDLVCSRKRQCNLVVEAVCVELMEKFDAEDNRSMYSPVWEFTHDGETKRIQRGFYTSVKKGAPEVGEKRTLHINSVTFDDYYESKPFDVSAKLFLFIGLGFTGVGIIGTLIAILFIQ